MKTELGRPIDNREYNDLSRRIETLENRLAGLEGTSNFQKPAEIRTMPNTATSDIAQSKTGDDDKLAI